MIFDREFIQTVLEENYAKEYWPGPDDDEPPKGPFQPLPNPLTETALWVAPKVRTVLEAIPVVSKADFLQAVKPFDVWITFTPNVFFRGISKPKALIKKSFSTMLATFQTSPFTSSKLVLDDGKTLLGYNVNPDLVNTKPNTITTYPTDKYLDILDIACLCRVPGLTAEQKARMTKYVEQKKNLPYDNSKLLKSLWNRVVKKDFAKFDLNEPDTMQAVRYYKDSLICSTIISLTFLYGYMKLFEHPMEVWPKDFILNDKIVKICRIE